MQINANTFSNHEKKLTGTVKVLAVPNRRTPRKNANLATTSAISL